MSVFSVLPKQIASVWHKLFLVAEGFCQANKEVASVRKENPSPCADTRSLFDDLEEILDRRYRRMAQESLYIEATFGRAPAIFTQRKTEIAQYKSNKISIISTAGQAIRFLIARAFHITFPYILGMEKILTQKNRGYRPNFCAG